MGKRSVSCAPALKQSSGNSSPLCSIRANCNLAMQFCQATVGEARSLPPGRLLECLVEWNLVDIVRIRPTWIMIVGLYCAGGCEPPLLLAGRIISTNNTKNRSTLEIRWSDFLKSISRWHASERSTRCRTRDGRTWARREPLPRRRNVRR